MTPQTLDRIFGVGDVAAFRMAALNVLDAAIRKASTEDLDNLVKWLGRVFAIAEHERRARRAGQSGEAS